MFVLLAAAAGTGLISPHFLETHRWWGAIHFSQHVTEAEKEPDHDREKGFSSYLERIIQTIPKEGTSGQWMGSSEQSDFDFCDQKKYLSREEEKQSDRQTQQPGLEKEPGCGHHQSQQERHIGGQS